MTHQLLLLFFLQIFVIEDHSKALTCTDFHSGKFELLSQEQNRKYIIERSGNFQSEETFNLSTGEKVDTKMFFKIIWVSDCEFSLEKDSTKSALSPVDKYITSKGGILNNIVSIDGNCANLYTTFEGRGMEQKICKIK